MSHFAKLQRGDMKTKGDLGTEGESVGFPSTTVGIVSLGEKNGCAWMFIQYIPFCDGPNVPKMAKMRA